MRGPYFDLGEARCAACLLAAAARAALRVGGDLNGLLINADSQASGYEESMKSDS